MVLKSWSVSCWEVACSRLYPTTNTSINHQWHKTGCFKKPYSAHSIFFQSHLQL